MKIKIPLETVTLKRIGKTKHETLGVLLLGDEFLCATLELAWKNNDPNISCIPTGEYVCEKSQSPKFGEVFSVQDVPGRSHILIHAGNYYADTQGCILVGESFSDINDDQELDIINSKKTLIHLLDYLPKKFILEII